MERATLGVTGAVRLGQRRRKRYGSLSCPASHETSYVAGTVRAGRDGWQISQRRPAPAGYLYSVGVPFAWMISIAASTWEMFS
jgi:hypothetical protein